LDTEKAVQKLFDDRLADVARRLTELQEDSELPVSWWIALRATEDARAGWGEFPRRHTSGSVIRTFLRATFQREEVETDQPYVVIFSLWGSRGKAETVVGLRESLQETPFDPATFFHPPKHGTLFEGREARDRLDTSLDESARARAELRARVRRARERLRKLGELGPGAEAPRPA
jgi:hypothetical protein